jgi:type IV secretory pathway VirJ component
MGRDVGWVGLAASMADDLSTQGYTVVGINVRQYLSAFWPDRNHLLTTDARAFASPSSTR